MQHITFLGAAGEVTGSSSFLANKTGQGILIDCGLFQGDDSSREKNGENFAINPKQIQAICLTHAHLDHCGRLPLLVRMGYFGKVYMTGPTKNILELALLDAVRVAENEHNQPLYTNDDVFQLLQQIVIVDYDNPIETAGYQITFRDAGHILGSASLEILDKNLQKRIVFSGDLGNTPEDLVKPTEYIEQADIVVMETTYGDKIHPQEDTRGIILKEIQEVEKSGGVLLIPAFSIDRTQVLLHMFNHFKKEGLLAEDTPVFLDSPMAIRCTEIYQNYPQLYSEELSMHAKKENPFTFPGLTLCLEGKDSREIVETRGTKIILAGSGMMTGGRIIHHAENYLAEVTTRLLFVGYQAERTLGRTILEGARQVIINNKTVRINATIREIKNLSAHADQPRLLNWLEQIKGVEQLFLIHGEEASRKTFAQLVEKNMNLNRIYLPENGEKFLIFNS